MGCIGLVFPLGCSFSLGDFNNLGLIEGVPVEERLFPLLLPPLFLDSEGKKGNTEVGGAANEDLLDELCLLSEKETTHMHTKINSEAKICIILSENILNPVPYRNGFSRFHRYIRIVIIRLIREQVPRFRNYHSIRFYHT